MDLPVTAPTNASEMAAAWGKATTIIRDLGAKVAAGERSASEMQTVIERQGQELKELRQGHTALSQAATARALSGFDGADSDLDVYRRADGSIRLRGYSEMAGPGEDDHWMPGLLDDVQARSPWHGALQDALTRDTIARTVLGRPHRGIRAELKGLARVAPGPLRDVLLKAFDGGSGTGDEFFQTPTLPVLEREVQAQTGNIRSLFPAITVSAQTTMLPVLGDNGRPFLVGSGSGENPGNVARTNITTAERTLSPVGMGMSYLVHDVASEDAIFNILPEMSAVLTRSLADGFEDCIINGDTSATHQDTGIASWDAGGIWNAVDAGTLDHRKAFDGLRRIAFAFGSTAYADWGTFTDDKFRAGINAIAKPRGRNGDLICLTSDAGMLRTFAAMTNVVTVDKYGAREPVLSGEVARYAGVRFVVNDFVPEDLNASGIFDNTTKTKTGALLFNRMAYRVINRRGARLELQRNALQMGTYIVLTARDSFKLIRSTSKRNAYFGYNLPV